MATTSPCSRESRVRNSRRSARNSRRCPPSQCPFGPGGRRAGLGRGGGGEGGDDAVAVIGGTPSSRRGAAARSDDESRRGGAGERMPPECRERAGARVRSMRRAARHAPLRQVTLVILLGPPECRGGDDL